MRKNRGIVALLLILAAAFGAGRVSAARSKSVYKLDSIQLFGTQRFTDSQLEEKLGDGIRIWFEARSRGTKADRARAEVLRRELIAKVRNLGPFGWANLVEVETGREKRVRKILLLFDVIEKEDMATRFPFRPAPTTSVKNETTLIEAWNQYTELGWKRVRSGEVSAERGECPAFFCPEGVGPGSDEIDALEDRIESEVPRHEELLAKIMREERLPQRRAAAVYLLTFLDDGTRVAAYAADALFDADAKVREAATAVFSDIAVYRKDVPIPVHKVVRLLVSPYPDDRGRALALALSLADNPDYESFLVSTAATDILKLLRVKNEATHDMAHTVLTVLSGEDFPGRDYDAWDNWLWKTRKERAGNATKDR